MAVIISLTSFGRRLEETAYRAICTLLDQTVPARVVLYPNNDPPSKLRNLSGLEIRPVGTEIGSYSKFVWALHDFPNDIIVTADDDLYYPRDWLENLLAQHERHPDRIVAHRAHCISFTNGMIAPYHAWKWTVSDATCLFPTGGSGALYPPNSLHSDTTNSDLFLKLCPKADDIWLWAMAILKGTQHCVVPKGYRQLNYISGSKAGGSALWQENIYGGGNDRQMRAVVNHYPALQEWVKQNCKTDMLARH